MKRGSARHPCPWCFWLLMVSLHIVILTAYRSTTLENEKTSSSGGLVPDLCTLLPFHPQMQLHATCNWVGERNRNTMNVRSYSMSVNKSPVWFCCGTDEASSACSQWSIICPLSKIYETHLCLFHSLQTNLLTFCRAPIKRDIGITEGVSEPFMLVPSKEQPRAVQPSDSSAFSRESQNIYDVALVTSTCDLCVKRFSHCCGRPIHSVPGTEARQAGMTQDEMTFD